MELSQIIPHIESLIFAADRPLPLLEILDLLNNALAFLEDRASLEQVETALDAIKEKYSSEFYPFEVRESGGGYQFLTKKEYYQTVAQLNGEKFLKRLSTAALETLAIVAYKQPISKGEIEHIRGVSTDYSIQKLLEKELIVISGRSETLPGKPLLYSTSKAFMDYFGLNSPKDLPKLKEVFDDEGIQPTLVGIDGNTESPDEDGLNMVVSETGELVERELLHDNEAGLNGHHVDVEEEIPVVDEDVPVTDLEDAADNDLSAGGIVPPVEDIPVVDEETPEAAEDKAEDQNDSADEDMTVAENEDSVVATDDDIAAFLEAAADLGPKGDDEEDDEDEEDEDFEDDDEDEESDEDEEDDDEDEEGDEDEEDDDDEDLGDEDEEDDEDDFEDDDDEDEEDEEDDEDVEENEAGNAKEEDVDDEDFYKDGGFEEEDEDEDDDDRK